MEYHRYGHSLVKHKDMSSLDVLGLWGPLADYVTDLDHGLRNISLVDQRVLGHKGDGPLWATIHMNNSSGRVILVEKVQVVDICCGTHSRT